jgi:O-methyltransferase
MTNREVAKWLEKDVAPSMLGYFDDLLTTFKLAQDVLERDVPGELIECGVYAGAHCAAIGKAIQLSGQAHRRLHIFDSFQGMPRCSKEDIEFVAANKQPGESNCSLAQVQLNMSRWGIPQEICIYHPGWFQDTVPNCGIDRIALLRLDGDLYESTKVCMRELWPKLEHSGFFILDDYPLSGARKAMHEVAVPQPGYFQKL